MATLTDASIVFKKVSKILVILLSFSLALIIFLVFGKSIRDQIFPPVAPPATVAFGKLPEMDLLSGFRPQAISYSIDTVSGELPALQPMAKVFAVEQPKVQFGDLERAKKNAQRVGFTIEPEQITPTKVKFTDPKNKQRTLTIETSTGNLVLESNWASDFKIITGRIRDDHVGSNEAREFFLGFGISREEFPDQNLQTIKYRVDAGKLTEVPTISQANLIKVIFKRADLDKLPILPEKEDDATIWALVSNNEVVAASLVNTKILRFKFATYPLKGVTKAFEDLKAQKAVFNNQDFSKNYTGKLAIKDISLGYIESKITAPYIQPVYLFKGNDFVAYVPAVSDAWVKKEEP